MAMTASMCMPQPVQVVLPQRAQRVGLHIGAPRWLVLMCLIIPPWVLFLYTRTLDFSPEWGSPRTVRRYQRKLGDHAMRSREVGVRLSGRLTAGCQERRPGVVRARGRCRQQVGLFQRLGYRREVGAAAGTALRLTTFRLVVTGRSLRDQHCVCGRHQVGTPRWPLACAIR